MSKKDTQNGFINENEVVEQDKQVKKTKKKNGKPGFFKRLGGKIKDIFSELKKVTWPTFPKIVKQTCVVLVVVLVFLVVITAFDFGLGKLLAIVAPRG